MWGRLGIWSKLGIIAGALFVIGAVTAGALYAAYPVQLSTAVGLTRNYLITLSAPAGTITTELNPAYKVVEAAVPSSPPARAAAQDWPSYNRTLDSDRRSPLTQINTKNAGQLKVLCTYDLGVLASFQSGLIMVQNALIGTTQFDIFSIDPVTCARELANARRLPSGPAVLSARRRLPGRNAVSRHAGRASAGL